MLTLESVTAWLRDNGQTAAVEALLSDADEPAAAAAAAAAAVAPDCDHSSSGSESRALNGGIGEESAPSGQSDPAPSEAAPSEAPPDRPQVAPRTQVAPTFSPRLSLPLPLRLSSCGLRAASREPPHTLPTDATLPRRRTRRSHSRGSDGISRRFATRTASSSFRRARLPRSCGPGLTGASTAPALPLAPSRRAAPPDPAREQGEQDDSDEEEDVECSERSLHHFSLKVVFDPKRNGLEETVNFPIDVGTVIAGRYRIVEYLGSGVFSRAVQCFDMRTGTMVRIKIEPEP